MEAMNVPAGYTTRFGDENFSCAESAESAEKGLPRIPRLSRNGTRWEPPPLDPVAVHGLAGAWAEAVQPFTEASVPGVLASTIVAFGNAVGGSPYVDVGATQHHCNEAALLVGPTSSGRKGETMTLGMRPLQQADPAWSDQVKRGFGSGEAIIEEVRDPILGFNEDGDEVVVTEGATDKRLLVQEDELAQVLAVAAREGSTLSPLMRNAWDYRRLENRVKHRKAIATNAHVSVLSGITPDELLRRVPELEIANGFLNRFLIVAVKRSKLLSDPPPLRRDLETEYVEAFRDRLAYAREHCAGPIRRDPDARRRWDRLYRGELAIDRYGIAGAACSRAEAHGARLSLLYALLDRSAIIRVQHVEAAVALWRYCEQSARLVFGDRLGDTTADTILEAIEQQGRVGITRDELRDVFSRHRSRTDLDLALRLLLDAGRITETTEETGGRPATRYRPAPQAHGNGNGRVRLLGDVDYPDWIDAKFNDGHLTEREWIECRKLHALVVEPQKGDE
jgi:Protein of unknown function (DUF3987)